MSSGWRWCLVATGNGNFIVNCLVGERGRPLPVDVNRHCRVLTALFQLCPRYSMVLFLLAVCRRSNEISGENLLVMFVGSRQLRLVNQKTLCLCLSRENRKQREDPVP
jgi:hypothetical protein